MAEATGVEAVIGLGGLESPFPQVFGQLVHHAFFSPPFPPSFLGQAKEEGEKRKRKVMILEGRCQS